MYGCSCTRTHLLLFPILASFFGKCNYSCVYLHVLRQYCRKEPKRAINDLCGHILVTVHSIYGHNCTRKGNSLMQVCDKCLLLIIRCRNGIKAHTNTMYHCTRIFFFEIIEYDEIYKALACGSYCEHRGIAKHVLEIWSLKSAKVGSTFHIFYIYLWFTLSTDPSFLSKV